MEKASFVLVVQPRDVRGVSTTLLALYNSVMRAMVESGIKYRLCTQHDLPHLVASEYTHVLVPSTAVLEWFSKTWAGHRIEYILLAVPSTYAQWGPLTDPLFDEIKEYRDLDLRVLTESNLARKNIESALDTREVEVYVAKPDFASVFNDPRRSVTDLGFDTRVEAHEGVLENWNFTGGMQSPASLASGLGGWQISGDYITDLDSLPSSLEIVEQELRGLTSTTPLTAQEKIAVRSTVQELFGPRSTEDEHISMTIFGNHLAFIEEMADDYRRLFAAKVQLDPWEYLSGPSNAKASERLLAESNVLVGEWARPNNIWIQKRAQPGQRVIVRAHRYEVTTDFPRAIDMDRFDAAVVIVPWVGRVLAQEFKWPAEKLVYIPNYINSRMFDREKLSGSEFTLGLVGITPSLKRLDLALDLLVALRKIDTRYTLRIRGRAPLDHPHWERDYRIRRQWGSIVHRLEVDGLLRNAVFFDAPGNDMASWFQQIGVVLSTSDIEGSHVALAEGIASGAVPIARRWPGIDTLWPEEVIFDDISAAVERVLAMRDESARSAAVFDLKKLACLDNMRVLEAWSDVVNGRMERARKAFGPIDWFAEPYTPVVGR